MNKLKIYLIIFTLLSAISIYITYDYTRILKEKENELKSLSMRVINKKNIKSYGYSDAINTLKNEGVIVKKITEKKDKNIIEAEGEIEGDLLKSYQCIKKINNNNNLKGINNIKFEENKDCSSLTKVNMDFIKNK